MKLNDFHYTLPEELIAKYPAPERSSSRLLCLNRKTGEMNHRQFKELSNLVKEKDLIVFNDSRVIPARLFGEKETGGRLEVLVERVLDSHQILAQIRASKSPKSGTRLILENHIQAEILGRQEDLFELRFLNEESVIVLLEKYGHMPLPPYIDRPDENSDQERYQTVYADPKGSVAAPTAGLHFDDVIIEQLRDKGVETAFLTLHVGAGTFQPVRVENIKEHQMHSEWITVPQDVCDKVQATKAKGGRVIAVGTTTVRSLETAALSGDLKSYEGETDIFIYPGFEFRVVDAMVTNFHLPESTLLMLVSAFAGREQVLNAYKEAIKQKYRFYSYGDAMFIY